MRVAATTYYQKLVQRPSVRTEERLIEEGGEASVVMVKPHLHQMELGGKGQVSTSPVHQVTTWPAVTAQLWLTNN